MDRVIKGTTARSRFVRTHLLGDFALGGFAGVLAFVTAVSCAPEGKKKQAAAAVVKECVLAESQQFSLQGRWAEYPIKVSLRSGDWDSGQAAEILAGADTWNSFFQKSKGFSIFNIGSVGSYNTSNSNQNAPSCGGGTVTDGTVIYRRQSAWTKSSTAIAVTTTCQSANGVGGATRLFNAIMEFNYINFFPGQGDRFPDLQSIAVHELGHLMGLDHSCGPLGRPNVNKPNAACPDPNASPDDPLVRAVMFRNVLFDEDGAGEVKRSLTDNDMGRANCLYQ